MGRDPAQSQRSWFGRCVCVDSEREPSTLQGRGLLGTPEQIVELLQAYIEPGIHRFMLGSKTLRHDNSRASSQGGAAESEKLRGTVKGALGSVNRTRLFYLVCECRKMGFSHTSSSIAAARRMPSALSRKVVVDVVSWRA